MAQSKVAWQADLFHGRPALWLELVKLTRDLSMASQRKAKVWQTLVRTAQDPHHLDRI